jgi:UDP-glucuronate decarboxylase
LNKDVSAVTKSILPGDLEHIHQAAKVGDRFRDSVVVVTGCAGFLGYYFLQYLVRYANVLGVREVIGLDSFLLRVPEWLTELQKSYPNVLKLARFDISKGCLDDFPAAKSARYVIHMASIASPMFYRQYPLETIDANIWGLRRLFDFYNGSQELRGFLFFSSSEIYGDPDPAHIPTDEEYRGNVTCTGPRACYDESKRFGETLCYVFGRKYGLPVTVARPFNNYGPGMRTDDKRLPADFAQSVLNNRDITMLSDGSPTRTFCYISDAICGYFLCLLHGQYDYFNIGIDKPEISVRQLAEIYCAAGREIMGYSGNAVFATSSDPEYLQDNPNRRCPTISKARTILGYAPEVHVEEGVRRYLRFLIEERI